MNSLLERGLYLPLSVQVAAIAVCGSLLALAVWLLLLLPRTQELHALQRQLALLEQRHQQQQVQQSALAAKIHQQQLELATPVQERAVPDLLVTRGEQLEAWLPESAPPVLTLRLTWPQFQPLFAELAQASVSFPTRFVLEAGAELLRVQLWLEDGDAP